MDWLTYRVIRPAFFTAALFDLIELGFYLARH